MRITRRGGWRIFGEGLRRGQLERRELPAEARQPRRRVEDATAGDRLEEQAAEGVLLPIERRAVLGGGARHVAGQRDVRFLVKEQVDERAERAGVAAERRREQGPDARRADVDADAGAVGVRHLVRAVEVLVHRDRRRREAGRLRDRGVDPLEERDRGDERVDARQAHGVGREARAAHPLHRDRARRDGLGARRGVRRDEAPPQALAERIGGGEVGHAGPHHAVVAATGAGASRRGGSRGRCAGCKARRLRIRPGRGARREERRVEERGRRS